MTQFDELCIYLFLYLTILSQILLHSPNQTLTKMVCISGSKDEPSRQSKEKMGK